MSHRLVTMPDDEVRGDQDRGATDLQALHRVRERLVSQRTGIINQIRVLPDAAGGSSLESDPDGHWSERLQPTLLKLICETEH